jgi:hypothetical protein
MLAGGDGDLIVSARNDLGGETLHPFGPPWLYSALILASRRRYKLGSRNHSHPSHLSRVVAISGRQATGVLSKDSYCGTNPGSRGPEPIIPARLSSGWRRTRCGPFGIGHAPSSAGLNEFVADDRSSVLTGRYCQHGIGATAGSTGPEETSSDRPRMLPRGERGLSGLALAGRRSALAGPVQ